ncbi:MAG: GH92 family glycosyl hydrolase [Clostridium sp.]|nr:GH92 family glycosyl hydrolase [Clostridium sp.]
MINRFMNILATVSSAAALVACSGASVEENFTQYVDTHIGTGGHGHVFVGANVPFGLVQLGPTSIPQTWDWCSGYHVSDSTVIGFSHTHLSGTGIGDLFDITVMPVTGDVTYARGTEEEPASGLWSYADRSREVSVPGYYSVPLTRYGITAELTATARVGFHRYTFPASENAAIVFDLENGGCWDKATDTHLEAVNADGEAVSDGPAYAIRGWRYSTGWSKDQKIYFYAEFSRPFESIGIINRTGVRDGDMAMEMPGYARLDFSTSEGEQVLLKVALSPVSMEGAKANMAMELPGWDFDATAKAADKAWNAELGKIRIETADEIARKVFYTALYHTMIAPSVFSDVDGSYRGADARNYPAGGFTNYTTFSLWDTYRAAMPLFSIIHPEKENDIVNTMLHIYRQQGKLPVWHLMGCETDCMVGNPGIPPVADAILKGYDGFDCKLAYEAMKASAMRLDRGQDLRMKYGYIPCDLFNEAVAYDMEYAIADWAIAQVAAKFAQQETDPDLKAAYEKDYGYFLERSHSYRNFFDPETGFMRGKTAAGAFRVPFNPFHSEHRADDYCEGNAWQYTWLVPHDFEGLVDCFGSKDALLSKLDSLFTVSSVIDGGASPDISGLIGQYAHGNEPSHHILYFYTVAGQPWKTAEKVREVLNTMYHAAPDGLSGNEDVGQMSAWYILSSLGFYQVEPAGGRYWFGSPLFDKAEIKVAGGTFKVVAENNSDKNIYIKSVKLNGRPYDKAYIDFADIATGGELVFEMSAVPVM